METIPTLNRPVEVSPLRVILVPDIESLNLEVPYTSKKSVGIVVPIPTKPLAFTIKLSLST